LAQGFGVKQMTSSQRKVGIVGGGIGGLTAALALLRRGIDVEVYEQSSVLKEVGAGVQIGSNGTRVLYALGLEEALSRVQVLPARREIRHWRTGETWNWFELGATSAERFGTPHLMLHRGDLLGVLAEAVRELKADAVTLGKRCVGIDEAADHAVVRFADGDARRLAFVVGADGIHSRLRVHVRRRSAAIHRLRGVARPRADGASAAAAAAPRIRCAPRKALPNMPTP
jgi:salicylate hydroxylase